ncbi:MAG: hypothetical protein ACYCW6_18075 [Candidatus Xenobia bacterium]
MTITVLVLLGTTLVVAVMGGLGASTSYADREVAYRAALAGLTYVQARLESNWANYNEGTYNANTTVTDSNLSNGLSISEFQGASNNGHPGGVTIIGELTSGNVAGAGGKQFVGLFRCTFNSDPNAYIPSDNQAKTYGSFTIPPCTFVSRNNLQNQTATTNTYDASTIPIPTIHSVVGQNAADVIVEGYSAVAGTSAGSIQGLRARRFVEGVFNVCGVAGIGPAAATAQENMTLNRASTTNGGLVNVGIFGSFNGTSPQALVSQAGSISLGETSGQALDSYSGSGTPPGYNNNGLLSDTVGGGSMTYNGSALPQSGIWKDPAPFAPASIPNIPAPSQAAINMPAGVWAIWNAGTATAPNNIWVHYSTQPSYDSAGNLDTTKFLPGTSTPTSTNWNGAVFGSAQPYPGGSAPPTYAGVQPDGWTTGGSGHTNVPFTGVGSLSNNDISFNNQTNVLTVSTQNIAVQSVTGGSSTINDVAVAPVPPQFQPQPSTGTVMQIQTQLAANTPTPQFSFQPGVGSNFTPDFRNSTGGSIAISGNVLGQVSVVTENPTSTSTTDPTNAGWVVVQGKSQLDPGQDSQVALYASGNVQMNALNQSDPPATVQNLTQSVASSNQVAIYAALALGLNQDTQNQSGGSIALGMGASNNNLGQIQQNIQNKTVQVTFNYTAAGQTTPVAVTVSGPVWGVVSAIYNGGAAGKAGQMGLTISGTGAALFGVSGQGCKCISIKNSGGGDGGDGGNNNQGTSPGNIQYELQSFAQSNPTFGTSSTPVFPNPTINGNGQITYTATTTALAGYATQSGNSGSTNGAQTASTGANSNNPFAQEFNGLVYTYHDFNVGTPTAPSAGMSMYGALVAYGGNPNANTHDGTSGNVNINANSMNLYYDPSKLLPLANLFQGNVTLSTASVTNG